jgi:hypothetical protein
VPAGLAACQDRKSAHHIRHDRNPHTRCSRLVILIRIVNQAITIIIEKIADLGRSLGSFGSNIIIATLLMATKPFGWSQHHGDKLRP